MKIIVAKNYEEISRKAAELVARHITAKPDTVMGLATGSTPLLMYKNIIKIHKGQGLSFSKVISFNLDEYIGISESNENSYHYYMWENFFKHMDILKKNIHMPDGNAKDIEEECRNYECKIEGSGGIDLQILGIGKNGHIGFNEPELYFEATTHKVKLDEDTISANSRFFNSIDDVPRYAISMGIKTIMKAKKILLLASGDEKAEATYSALKGKITPDVPASILQLHQDVIVLVDEAANKILGAE